MSLLSLNLQLQHHMGSHTCMFKWIDSQSSWKPVYPTLPLVMGDTKRTSANKAGLCFIFQPAANSNLGGVWLHLWGRPQRTWYSLSTGEKAGTLQIIVAELDYSFLHSSNQPNFMFSYSFLVILSLTQISHPSRKAGIPQNKVVSICCDPAPTRYYGAKTRGYGALVRQFLPPRYLLETKTRNLTMLF